ncbi:MAG TPA: hypothetical protein VM143_05915, partial [Acidimicrobiales bacterium]|nr:hypothetical protein [Acidimicrobiales bacterium]
PELGDEQLEAEEDELLIAEQIVLEARVSEAYDHDVVRFFRTLAVVLVVGLVAWVVVGAVALELYSTLTVR